MPVPKLIFLTEDTANFLNLTKKPTNISVIGIDNTSTVVKYSAQVTLKSRFSQFQKTSDFLIVPQISQTMPSITIDYRSLEIPKNIKLADPEFFKPSKIDALIGVKLFYKLLSVGQIALKNNPEAVLQKTQLGWIVAGEFNQSSHSSSVSCHISLKLDPPDADLTRFWEIEELQDAKLLSSEEKACEEHYAQHTKRNLDGRYEVQLPFNNKKHALGDSYSSALKRFHILERKFQKYPRVKKDYVEFLNEYKQLGHMSLSTKQDDRFGGFFLPHHAVIKEVSITTKIRVVFDGSARTSTGVSLNDVLMVGPKLQDDLFIILNRFRSHMYVFTADIEKMSRQVLVHSEDAQHQNILFRENPTDPVLIYLLNTVTYGTASASYLAIKSLYQLADDEGANFPNAATVLRRDFYVDDMLTGARTIPEAVILRDELIALLKKGGFCLKKWASNHPEMLVEHQEHPESTHMSLDPDASIKTLGIRWNAREDHFFYEINIKAEKSFTKRSILSQIAKLFDPLGLLGPIIVYAKIILQCLWKAGVSWDESIPLEIHSSWSSYQNELGVIKQLRFHRWVTITNPVNVQLHGFCDAS